MQVSVTRDRGDPRFLAISTGYNPVVVAAIKSVPGRKWDKSRKIWLIPDTPENVLSLHNALPHGAQLDMPVELRVHLRERFDQISAAQKIRDAGDHATDFPFFTEPYAHQRAGLGFLQGLGSGALLWEMGLGKTKTAIDYCQWLALKSPELRVLVIAPNSVTDNWVAEVGKHTGTPQMAEVLRGTLKQRTARITAGLSKLGRYTIVNTEALSLAPLNVALAGAGWDVVIADESTRFKSPKANRTKMLHKIKARHRLIMTGTPITNSPEDAWAQFEFVQPGLFGSYWAFQDAYLTKDFFGNVTGVKPNMAPEIARRVNSRSYRILKADVLDLPPKVYVDRHITLAGKQLLAYNQMRDELRVELENTPSINAATVLVQLLRLTQITAGMIGHGDEYEWLPDNAKVTELDDLLNDELAGESVVVIGLYQRELEELARRYLPAERRYPDQTRPHQPIIYGPTPPEIRTRLIDEFQQRRRRLLFIQERTGGIGINLTAAQTVVYYTRSWSLEDYLQSQDRLHRIGQTGTVTVLHLVAKGTIDEDIAKALSEKQTLADTLTGDDARKLAARVLGGKINAKPD